MMFNWFLKFFLGYEEALWPNKIRDKSCQSIIKRKLGKAQCIVQQYLLKAPREHYKYGFNLSGKRAILPLNKQTFFFSYFHGIQLVYVSCPRILPSYFLIYSRCGVVLIVMCLARLLADPAGLRSLRPSRPRPSGAVQRPGTCTADASWHSSALCTVLALRERPNTRPFLVPSLAFYQLILTYDVLAGSFLMRLALLKVSKSQKYFFLKLHCPKNEQNIRQDSAIASQGRILSNISFSGLWNFKKNWF